jgi:hypothetical protein
MNVDLHALLLVRAEAVDLNCLGEQPPAGARKADKHERFRATGPMTIGSLGCLLNEPVSTARRAELLLKLF